MIYIIFQYFEISAKIDYRRVLSMRKLLITICITNLCLLTFSPDHLPGKNFPTRSEILAQNGMATTSQSLVTQVALDILKKGAVRWTQLLQMSVVFFFHRFLDFRRSCAQFVAMALTQVLRDESTLKVSRLA